LGPEAQSKAGEGFGFAESGGEARSAMDRSGNCLQGEAILRQ